MGGLSTSNFTIEDDRLAWDGDCIHDRPYLSKVNNTYDRTNPEKSKLAFAKLFKTTEFKSWQITSVYRLCQ